MPRRLSSLLLIALTLVILATPSEAFGAGYVSRGSHLKTSRYRHGDIALAVPLLATANRRLVKQLYFGNWLRDFSQLLDRSSLSLVPRPLLRALVAVFAFVQFGYATGEFEVTDERLGFYRPEEHVDNPKGYDNGSYIVSSPSQASATEKVAGYQISEGLRPAVQPVELDVDPDTGIKNYIANSSKVGNINPTSADYVEKQLIAAVACGRQGDEEAYIHLGAALHALEDFLAHSNYIELAMQRIGQEIQDQSKLTPALKKVFAFVGEGVQVKTALGPAPPITTGTFGALDLFQTLLGEVEDRASAMSLPGLELRTDGDEGPLKSLAKYLIGLLGSLTPDFELDILKIQKSVANPHPAGWSELEQHPEKLWAAIEPVFRLRDNVVKWVNDNLKVRAVQDALAAISTAIDKLVYMVLGLFLGPLLSEFRRVLKDQEQRLLVEDQKARLATGEQSLFDKGSTASDPTHSQLAKDHYDHVLNEIAGRVAVRVSSFTITAIVRLWQPGSTADPLPSIHSILQTFHHPSNSNPASPVQTLMLAEVRRYVRTSLVADLDGFTSTLRTLSAPAVASRMDAHAGGHTHVDAQASIPDPATREQRDGFMQKMTANIERQLNEGAIKDIGIADFPAIKNLLFADPSGESPNPLDSGLAKIPGLSFLRTFEGVGLDEIATADGMGETLKDAVITMILLDETRGEVEEDVAAGRFGVGTTTTTTMATTIERNAERARLKELRAMLEIRRSETRLEEGQFDPKRSMGDKLKIGIGKLKLAAKN